MLNKHEVHRTHGDEQTNDAGFTIIELMVVVLIIAILVGIGIPSFLAARDRAERRAAQTTARNALTGARSVYAASGSYGQATTTQLADSEPALAVVPRTASSADANTVSVDVPDDETFVGAVYSASGTCYYVRDVVGVSTIASALGTSYAQKESDGSDCSAADIPADVEFDSEW